MNRGALARTKLWSVVNEIYISRTHNDVLMHDDRVTPAVLLPYELEPERTPAVRRSHFIDLKNLILWQKVI